MISRLCQYGEGGVYFYGDNLKDPEKTWVDPGSIELFLDYLMMAQREDRSVLRLIAERCPLGWLRCRWFIVPGTEEYHPDYGIPPKPPPPQTAPHAPAVSVCCVTV